MTKPTDPWMPLYIADYLADTGRLTTEGHGAYLLLLMDYWRNGPPPDDDETLAAITKLPLARWQKLRPNIQVFFQVAEGVWRNKRADEERATAVEITNERSSAGKKGAEARWGKRAGGANGKADGGANSRPYGKTDDAANGARMPEPMAKPMANEKQKVWQNDAPSPSPSVPNGTGADAQPDLLEIPLTMVRPPNGDWSVALFRQGLAWIAQVYGKPPNALRPFVGKCLKAAQNDHKRVFEVFAMAQRNAIADPQPWVLRALAERSTDFGTANPVPPPPSAFALAAEEWVRNGCKGERPKPEDFTNPGGAS
jgi:uncharacterized protein YdaU (DUF1376 family)